MIIEMLLNLIYTIFNTLLVFEIPNLPESIYNIFQEILWVAQDGAIVLGAYTHLPYLFVLFGIIFVVDTAINVYYVVMWIIKKIPVLGIE